MNYNLTESESDMVKRWAKEHLDHWDEKVRALSSSILVKLEHSNRQKLVTSWDAILKPSGGYSVHTIIPKAIVKEMSLKCGDTVKFGIVEESNESNVKT